MCFEKLYKQLSKLKPRPHLEKIATKINITALAHNCYELKPDKSVLFSVSEKRNVIWNIKKRWFCDIFKAWQRLGVLYKTDYINKIHEIIGVVTKFTLHGQAKKFVDIKKLRMKMKKILKSLLFTMKNKDNIYYLIKAVGFITKIMYG